MPFTPNAGSRAAMTTSHTRPTTHRRGSGGGHRHGDHASSVPVRQRHPGDAPISGDCGSDDGARSVQVFMMHEVRTQIVELDRLLQSAAINDRPARTGAYLVRLVQIDKYAAKVWDVCPEADSCSVLPDES